MTLALAKVLVERGLVGAAEMDDALQRQVIYGGSLDTNLLEMGLLDETRLTAALGEIHHLPVATPQLILGWDPRMVKLFPSRLAQKYRVAPVMLSGRSVQLLASGRPHPLVVEEIGFMLSLAVKTSVVCEARLNILLRNWMGVEIEPRFAVLAERMGETLPAAAPPAASPETQATVEALAARLPPAPLDPNRVQRVLGSIEAADRREEERRARARSGRLSLTEATQACLNASSREQIVDTVLRFSRQFLTFVGLFVVNNDAILGWEAVGSEGARERLRKIRLPLGAPSVLHTVVDTRAHFLGPVPPSGINDELMRVMGRGQPRNVLIVPVLLKERVVGLLYGDGGVRSIRGSRLVELLVFVSRLSAAFEQLILRRKAADKAVHAAQEPESPVASLVETVAAEPPAPAADLETPPQKPGPVLSPLSPELEFAAEPAPLPEPPPPASIAQVPAALAAESPEAAPGPPPAEPAVAVQVPAPPDRPAEVPQLVQPPVSELEGSSPLDEPPSAGLGVAASGEEPVVVDEGFVEGGQVVPAIDAAELGIPMAMRVATTVEEPVRIEPREKDLERPINVMDGETEVVVVDSAHGFAPEPAPVSEPEPLAFAPSLVSQPPPADEGEKTPSPEIPEPIAIERLADELITGSVASMEAARLRLVAIGAAAVPALVKRFPGKLLFDVSGSYDTIPPLSEHSVLLHCLIEIGEDASAALADRLEDPDSRVRYYAVKFLGEVRFPRAVSRLARRLYDREALIRLAVIDTLQCYRKTTQYDAMLADLRSRLKLNNPDQQAVAAALLGNFRDHDALPLLVGLVGSPHKMVARVAVESLSYITKQDFGGSERKWVKWLKLHKGERRVQWLIGGLRSKNRDIRFSASHELGKITSEYFGYYFDSDPRDRERAVLRWERWWDEKGRRMHFEE